MNRLRAFDADAFGLPEQAFERTACTLRVGAEFLFLALAHFGNGGARRRALLDRVKGPGVVGLALRRHGILIAGEAFLEAIGIEINAETIGVDILAAARA